MLEAMSTSDQLTELALKTTVVLVLERISDRHI